MMRDVDYALRGSLYEVQKTLEAFFGRCEVTVREDIPKDCVEVEVKYQTHGGVKWYRHAVPKMHIEACPDVERYLAQDIPYRIVMDELHAAKKSASSAMNHFR